ILQRFTPTRDETSHSSERVSKRATHEGKPDLEADGLRSSPAMFAAAEHRMRFVNKNARAIGIRHIKHFPQISEIAIHRINAFDHHELASALLTAQRHVERCGSVLLEVFRATQRPYRGA